DLDRRIDLLLDLDVETDRLALARRRDGGDVVDLLRLLRRCDVLSAHALSLTRREVCRRPARTSGHPGGAAATALSRPCRDTGPPSSSRRPSSPSPTGTRRRGR